LAVDVTDMLRSPPIEAERAAYARQRVAEYNLRGRLGHAAAKAG
jgi:hypothetical protein